MGAIAKLFDKIIHVIEDSFKMMIDVIKKAVETFVGVFKQLAEDLLKFADALVTLNFKLAAESLLSVAQDCGSLASLPETVAAAAAMTLAQDVLKEAAKVLGMENQPWMKDIVKGLAVASNFTSLRGAAETMAGELFAKAEGVKSPLQQQWENTLPSEKDIKDPNYSPENEPAHEIA